MNLDSVMKFAKQLEKDLKAEFLFTDKGRLYQLNYTDKKANKQLYVGLLDSLDSKTKYDVIVNTYIPYDINGNYIGEPQLSFEFLNMSLTELKQVLYLFIIPCAYGFTANTYQVKRFYRTDRNIVATLVRADGKTANVALNTHLGDLMCKYNFINILDTRMGMMPKLDPRQAGYHGYRRVYNFGFRDSDPRRVPNKLELTYKWV